MQQTKTQRHDKHERHVHTEVGHITTLARSFRRSLLSENKAPRTLETYSAGPGPYGVGAPRLWGVPVVETDALTPGTALVGDFSKAVLFDRQSLAIARGTINDQFVRNMVTGFGEIRAGFGVVRPSAFVKATLA